MSTKAIKRERSSFQAWLQKESTAGLVFSLPFIVGGLAIALLARKGRLPQGPFPWGEKQKAKNKK